MVEVSGERLLLHTLLGNCLKNAVEASPEGGVVGVDLSVAEDVIARVNNRGAVPEAIRGTFFGKFSTAGKVGGTGLGAYSSKRIAEVHGGSIAMSRPEEAASTWDVFVYGTLRQGFCNHFYLDKARFLGPATTRDGHVFDPDQR